MIGRIRGMLLEKNPPQIVVEAGGLGYEIDVPMSTFYALPNLGESVSLLTQLIIREDAHLLFGFLTVAERSTFRELLKISGVGARTALSVLSGLSVDELARAITTQDVARLVRIPGIGKKTAERLLLELKGKLGGDLGGAAPGQAASLNADVLNALIALGYSEREAAPVVKSLPADLAVSEGIRQALKFLGKG